MYAIAAAVAAASYVRLLCLCTFTCVFDEITPTSFARVGNSTFVFAIYFQPSRDIMISVPLLVTLMLSDQPAVLEAAAGKLLVLQMGFSRTEKSFWQQVLCMCLLLGWAQASHICSCSCQTVGT